MTFRHTLSFYHLSWYKSSLSQVFAVSNSPNNHPCIHSEEKAFLNAQIPQYDISKVPIPWKKILFSKAMFAVIISQIGHDWGYFVMMTCLPKYIETVLQFSINSNGAIMSLPYIVMFIWTNLAGRLADWLVKSKNMEIGYQRRLFNLLGKNYVVRKLHILFDIFSNDNRCNWTRRLHCTCLICRVHYLLGHFTLNYGCIHHGLLLLWSKAFALGYVTILFGNHYGNLQWPGLLFGNSFANYC